MARLSLLLVSWYFVRQTYTKFEFSSPFPNMRIIVEKLSKTAEIDFY
jgi:hypothetical protein